MLLPYLACLFEQLQLKNMQAAQDLAVVFKSDLQAVKQFCLLDDCKGNKMLSGAEKTLVENILRSIK